jgi:cell division protein FtsB
MSRNQDKIENENSDWARKQAGTVLAAESLRNSAAPGEAAAPAPRADDRISAFWRIFGGTVLSIVTLIILTAFQQLSASLSNMNSKIEQLKDNSTKFVEKEEFSNRMTRFWDNVKGPTAEVPALKAQVAAQDAQFKEAEKERKELCKEIQALKGGHDKFVEKEEFSSRMTRFWDNIKGPAADVPALKAQVATQDAQLKEAEKERKELCKEVQALRERLAGLEAHHAAGKSSASGKDAPADK